MAELRAEYELTAAVRALGGAVQAVRPPAKARSDERKPKGVARALEAAGLRQRPAEPAGAADEDESAEE